MVVRYQRRKDIITEIKGVYHVGVTDIGMVMVKYTNHSQKKVKYLKKSSGYKVLSVNEN